MPSSDIDGAIPNPCEDSHAYEEDEMWVCWGHKDYVKPSLSETWITEDLAERPTTMPLPSTLDGYDSTPKFSVLPRKYENCIPSSVQKVLKDFNVLHKFVDRISFSSSENGERKNENPPLSGSIKNISSVENPPLSGSIKNISSVEASTKILKPSICHGNPVVYRKKDDINVEKTGNERRSKKAAKQQRKMQKTVYQSRNFSLQEEENNLNGEVSLIGSKQYTLRINQVSDFEAGCPKTMTDTSQDPPPVHAFIENLRKIHDQTLADNLTSEFPPL